jgi:rhodanese-related sulfurtransferase
MMTTLRHMILRHKALVVVAVLALLVGASVLVVALRSSSDDEPDSIPVLAYHGVTTDAEVVEGADDQRFFDVRLAAFEEQMRHLDDAGYRTVTPDQYAQWVDGDEVALPDKPVLITFDDGQTSAQLATPALEEHGFEAVMYVVSGFADGAFGGPDGEPGWYLTWDELVPMAEEGPWIMQFHAGPRGHAYIDDAAFPDCHRFYPCRFGEDDATYQERVKSDVAQGLGAMRTAFGLPDDWRGSTFAVPWDDAAMYEGTAEPWLAAYFADQFPVVFVQDSYDGGDDNQRFRFEVHNPQDLDEFRDGLDSPDFAR